MRRIKKTMFQTKYFQLLFPLCCLFVLQLRKLQSIAAPTQKEEWLIWRSNVEILIGVSGCKSHSRAPLSSTETSVISPPPSAFQEVASPTVCAFSSVSCHMNADGCQLHRSHSCFHQSTERSVATRSSSALEGGDDMKKAQKSFQECIGSRWSELWRHWGYVIQHILNYIPLL